MSAQELKSGINTKSPVYERTLVLTTEGERLLDQSDAMDLLAFQLFLELEELVKAQPTDAEDLIPSLALVLVDLFGRHSVDTNDALEVLRATGAWLSTPATDDGSAGELPSMNLRQFKTLDDALPFVDALVKLMSVRNLSLQDALEVTTETERRMRPATVA